MSTDPNRRDLDDAASQALAAVQGQMTPELQGRNGKFILCFYAPRVEDEFPWLFATVGVNGAKINIVRYDMSADDEQFPEAQIITYRGLEYRTLVTIFSCDDTTAIIDLELSGRAQEIYLRTIKELLGIG